MFVNLINLIDIIKHPPQNGGAANLQKRFGEILCKLAKTSGIACGNNYILHALLCFNKSCAVVRFTEIYLKRLRILWEHAKVFASDLLSNLFFLRWIN